MKCAWLRRAGVLCLVAGTVDLWALNDLVLPEIYENPLPRKVAHAAAVRADPRSGARLAVAPVLVPVVTPVPASAEPVPVQPAPAPAQPAPVQPAPAPEPGESQPEPIVVVEFLTNSRRVERAALRRLAAVLARLNSEPRVTVVGHADASGPDEFNERLSKQRAESVAQSLSELGVERGRLHLAWYGERRPRGQGDDKRVEIYLGEAP